MSGRQRPSRETPCAECGMPCLPTDYHPHLFCTLWKAYRVHPQVLLGDLGFSRRPKMEADIAALRAWQEDACKLIVGDDDALTALDLLSRVVPAPAVSPETKPAAPVVSREEPPQ